MCSIAQPRSPADVQASLQPVLHVFGMLLKWACEQGPARHAPLCYGVCMTRSSTRPQQRALPAACHHVSGGRPDASPVGAACQRPGGRARLAARGALGQHGLDRERLADHHHARLAVAHVRDHRRAVEVPADAVAHKVGHHAQAIPLANLVDDLRARRRSGRAAAVQGRVLSTCAESRLVRGRVQRATPCT